MSENINSIDIQISSSSNEASKAIDQLIGKLGNLKSSLETNLNVTSPINNLNKLSGAINSISSGAISKLNGLSGALNSFNGVGNVKISSSISRQITNISESLNSVNGANFDKVSGLVNAVNLLSNISTGKGAGSSSTVGGTISRIVKSLKELESLDLKGSSTQNIKDLIKSLEPLAKLDKGNLGSVLNQLKKIPEVFRALKQVDLKDFRNTISSLTTALKPLASQLDTVGSKFAQLPNNVRKTNNAIASVESSAKQSKLSKAFSFGAMIYGFNRLGQVVGGFLKQSNQYIEDLNLFTASMGAYAKESQKYAETVGELVGLDPAEFMRNQGIFMTLATGFGIANDKASIMSKNLTQLGYDISSFFNIDYKEAMLKLQSGLAGELEPLRRIGYDLSKAKLEANALSLGITKSYNDMTQAEKSALRYHAIMTQVTTVQGDMARTLQAPSNQLRILQAQFTQLARAIGNIFIPVLNAVLPYLIMITKGLRAVADQIASFFGFKLPEVDYSSLNPVMNEIPEAIGDAADNADNLGSGMKKARQEAEKYRNTVLGFDELNILNDVNEKASDLGGKKGKKGKGEGIGGIGNIPVPEYDFLNGLVKGKLKDIEKALKPFIEWLKDNFDYILRIVGSIAAGIAAWKIVDWYKSLGGIGGIFNTIKDFFAKNRFPIGIGLMVTGVTLSALSGFSLGYNGFNWRDMLTMLLGNALTIGGSLLALGTGPTGWFVGIGLSIVVDLISVMLGRNARLRDDDLKARFGNINLTDDEAFAWAKNITATMAIKNVEVYLNERDTLVTIRGDLQKIVDNINRDNKRIALGMEVKFEDYQANIDEYIATSQKYLDQNMLTMNILFDGEFGKTETGARLSKFTQDVYSENKKKLDDLGLKLKQAVSDSFKDGEWIPNKLEEAKKIQEEINVILEKVSHIEFEARIQTIQMEFGATDLSHEAFTKMKGQLQKAVTEREAELSELNIGRLSVVIQEYEANLAKGMSEAEAMKIRQKAEDDINREFKENLMEIQGASATWQLGGINEAFRNELSVIRPVLEETATDILGKVFPDGVPEEALQDIFYLTNEMGQYFNDEFSKVDMTPAAKSNLQDLLKALAPTMAEVQKVADEHTKLGNAVPESIANAISDYQNLQKLSGAIDVNQHLIGKAFGKDSGKGKEVLDKAKSFGNEIPEEIVEGIEVGKGLVPKKVQETTDKIKETIDDNKPSVGKKAEELGSGINTGIQKGIGAIGMSTAIDGLWNDIENKWNNTKRDLNVFFGINVKEKYETVAATATSSYKGGTQFKKYATGGFPTKGEMFIARESGPEMVGSIGSRPTVANNDQIVSAVSTGVAQAVSQTLGSNQGGDIVVVVKNPNEVTGKEVYRQNIAKARREGGR